MNSSQIAKSRKEIENAFREEANILNGQLSSAKTNFDERMRELQKQCPHIWDSGEDAIQRLGSTSLCTICRKKI